MSEIDNLKALSMPATYAGLTPVDAEAILGAGGEYLFTCNYNKLTRDTHPKLIEKLVNKAKVAEKNGTDFSPIFVSQLGRMTLVLDIYRDDTIVDNIIKPYIDSAYPERLSIVYKVEFPISKNEVLTLDLGPVHAETHLAKLYIVHPVASLSELYLPNSLLGTTRGVYSAALKKEEYDWMGLDSEDVSNRMAGMTPPFCGTEAHRQISTIFSTLFANMGFDIATALKRINSVVDIRYGAVSVLPIVKSTSKNMYTKKLCVSCPNSLLCMASGVEPVNPVVSVVSDDNPAVAYNAHLIQQTCIETYFRELVARLGLSNKMLSKKILLLQQQIDTNGVGCGKGYATQYLINIVTGICRNSAKSVEWLQSKIKADGVSWAPLSANKNYDQGIKQPMTKMMSPAQLPYHKASLATVAQETRLLPNLNLIHNDYYPGRYDKRGIKQELRPAVLPLNTGNIKEAVSMIVNSLHVSAKSIFGISLPRDSTVMPDPEALTDLVMQVLQPLITTEYGKSYLKVNTAFTDETGFQGIHKTMLEIKRLIKNNTRLFPLSLKEYTYVQKNAETKISSAVCSAFLAISKSRYNSTSKCKHALTCRHAGNGILHGCGLRGLKTSEWASKYGFTSGAGHALMPCTGPITDGMPLISQGPDIIYQKLCQKFPLLDNSLRVLAAHLERIRKRNINAGGAVYDGVNTVCSPNIRGNNQDITRGAALRTVSLYVVGDHVYPVVMSPNADFQRDVHRCEEEHLSRLLAFVPQEGKDSVRRAYLKSMTKQYTRDYGEDDTSNYSPLIWIPTDIRINNTNPEATSLMNELPAYNLRAVDEYNQDLEMLSPSQLLLYEQLRMRVIPILSPAVYPTLLINGGNYENGALQMLHYTAELSKDKAGQSHELQIGVPQLTLFTVLTVGQEHSMSHNISSDISSIIKNRKTLMPFESKTIIAKDSKIHAFITKSDTEGEIRNISVVKHAHGGVDMASHSGANYISYTDKGCAIQCGWDSYPAAIPALVPIVNSRSKETQQNIRKQLYRADYELLLSNYWIVNGIQTSALGVNALIIGSAATIDPDVVPEVMVS